MYERFTDRARKVMALANQEAQRFNHDYIGTEHVLLGLIKEGSGVAANVLKNFDVDLGTIRLEVEKLVPSGPDVVADKLPQTPRTKQVLDQAMEEARSLGHNYVGSEHLLLGLLREGEGIAAQVLANLDVKRDDVRAETLCLLGRGTDAPLPAPDDSQAHLEPLAAHSAALRVTLPLAGFDLRSRLTDRARRVLQLAEYESLGFNYPYVGTEHIALAIVKLNEGTAATVLQHFGVDRRSIRLEIEKCVQAGPDPVVGVVTQSLRAKKMFDHAIEEARRLDHDFVGTEHLLLGLLRNEDCVPAQVLNHQGVTLAKVREEVLRLVGRGVK